MTSPSKPLIIGVSGKKRSGKDTLFQTVRTNFPELTVERRAFADKVKEYTYKYFNVDPDSDKESYRHILQGVGQMVRSEFNENYWIQQATKDLPKCDVLFFTDVRHLNEWRAVTYLGGKNIRVDSINSDDDFHPSETDLDFVSFSYYIENRGTLEEYEEAIVEWFEEIWRKHNGN